MRNVWHGMFCRGMFKMYKMTVSKQNIHLKTLTLFSNRQHFKSIFYIYLYLQNKYTHCLLYMYLQNEYNYTVSKISTIPCPGLNVHVESGRGTKMANN